MRKLRLLAVLVVAGLALAASFSAESSEEEGSATEIELLLTDFEGPRVLLLTGPERWPDSSVELTTQQVHGGKYAAKLHYEFVGNPSCAGVAWYAPVLGEPQEFQVWTYGDGQMRRLRLQLRDPLGRMHRYDLGRIHWRGWRQLFCSLAEAEIPQPNVNLPELVPPVQFDCLLIEGDSERCEGDVYFDDITYVTRGAPPAALGIETDSGWFGNVIFSGDPWELRTRVTNRRLAGNVSGQVEMVATDSRGARVAEAEQDVALAAGATTDLSLKPQRLVQGLITVQVKVRDGATHMTRLCVLPKPHPFERTKEPFFGLITRFGESAHVLPGSMRLMRQVGVEWFQDELRSRDPGWRQHETEDEDLACHDPYMQAAAEAGLNPLITLGCPVGDSFTPRQDVLIAYGSYLATRIERYDHVCKRWAVSPDIESRRGSTPSVASYARALEVLYSYARATMADDREAAVLCLLGPIYESQAPFLDSVLAQCGQDMDGVCLRLSKGWYASAPEEKGGFLQEVGLLREAMCRNGMAGWKVWLIHSGWMAGPANPSYSGVTEQAGANWLVRLFVLARNLPYVAGVACQELQDRGPLATYGPNHVGLLQWRTAQAKPALVAYWVMTRHLGGADLVEQILPRGDGDARYLFHFQRGTEHVLVGWSAGEESVATLSLGSHKVRLQWADASSEERGVDAQKLTLRLTEMPVFVTGGSAEVHVQP